MERDRNPTPSREQKQRESAEEMRRADAQKELDRRNTEDMRERNPRTRSREEILETTVRKE